MNKQIKDVSVRVPMTEKGHLTIKVASAVHGKNIGKLVVDALRKSGIDVQK